MIEAFGGREAGQKGFFEDLSSLEDGKNDVQQSILWVGRQRIRYRSLILNIFSSRKSKIFWKMQQDFREEVEEKPKIRNFMDAT